MRVVVDGEVSDPAPVLSGVPQGTVLGPLLFLIHINDITQVVSDGTFVRLFADDCLVYRCVASHGDQVILQRDLDAMQAWADRWGMRFNPGKCQIMQIRRTSHLPSFYQLCDTVLETVSCAKYLGVIISQDLQWDEHIAKMAKNANYSLHTIYRNLKHCPFSTRKVAFCALTRPRLEYCASVWDPFEAQHINKLERINRRGARTVYNKTWRDQEVSPTHLLKELGWKSLEARRRVIRLSMLYRIQNNLVAVPPTHLHPPARNLRGHHLKLQPIRTTHNRVKNSFYPRTITQWNSLHPDIVAAPTIDAFRARLSGP